MRVDRVPPLAGKEWGSMGNMDVSHSVEGEADSYTVINELIPFEVTSASWQTRLNRLIEQMSLKPFSSQSTKLAGAQKHSV